MDECVHVEEKPQSAGFEGFEKRLDLEFFPAPSDLDPYGTGLRRLSRDELDKVLQLAECTIVAELKNEHFDSYVLSESSLFVYPLKIVLKTCGTTQLLRTIPCLLESSGRLNLRVSRCKYTRGTFMFPSVQPYPHGNFDDEVHYLDKYFGNMGPGSKSYIMGDLTKFPNWHIYVAADDNASCCTELEPTYTLEMCMTDLDQSKAHQFYNGDGSLSGLDMTRTAGIDRMLPKAAICDFAFKPCGYSMNSLEDAAHSTIHVTPEDGMSYASFETMGYGPKTVNLQDLVDAAVSVFRPGTLALSVHVSHQVSGSASSWGGASVMPSGYFCVGSTRKELPGGSVVLFHTFELQENDSMIVPLPW